MNVTKGSFNPKRGFVGLKIASLLVVLAASALAQSAGGLAGIGGVVRDPSGSLVPNATVVVSNESNGTARTLTTNESGVFTAPALVPAPGYKVTVTVAGFAKFETRDISLEVGQNLELNLKLSLVQSTTMVDVVAAAPLVEETKTDVSGVVDTRSITDLPINGRRVDSFVLLQPGVSSDGTYGLLSFRGVAAGNAFLVD